MYWCRNPFSNVFLSICFLIVTATFSSLNPSPANAQDICKPSKDQALVEAISYHRRIGIEGAGSKQLWGDALKRAVWCEKSNEECAVYFKRNAQKYIEGHENSALILYARDQKYMCAFMFSHNHPVNYARREIEKDEFNDGVKKIRTAHAGNLGRTIGKRRQRSLVNLRNGECNRPWNRGFIPSSSTEILSDPAIEQRIASLLFPSEFHTELRTKKHLSIIPFGPITTLPIGTIKPFDDERQVVDLFTVNYLLFAGEVTREPMLWAGKPKRALIIGNPVSTKLERARCMEQLPAAEQEASMAHRMFKGTYLSREKATRNAFKVHAKHADLIYIAAHALAGLEDGIADSFIALADDNLTARDIQRFSNFKYTTSLVVMSACQTGLGRINEFGVIGLARTFLDVGARNTLMSLWSIDDKATETLMGEFNRHLAKNSPSEALQIAQQFLRNETDYKDPTYWSGFAIYGNQMRIAK